MHLLGRGTRLEKTLRLSSLLLQSRFDVIHAHSGGRLERFLARSTGSSRILSHIHGYSERWAEPLRNCAPAARAFAQHAVAHAHKVIACSRWLSGALECALRPACPEVEVLYCGVDIDHFTPTAPHRELRESLKLRESSTIIGFSGRLVPQKGLRYLLAAAEIVTRDRPETAFVVVGDGPLRQSLESAGRSAGLDGFRFVGEKSDVRPYLALFDVLVVPSEWEPFGITSLEAMATEKPVIAFDVDGIPEVVQNKVTGLLTPHRDVTALAQAITLLVDSPGLRTDLGKSGRQRVQNSFSAAVTARELERIYQELVGARLA